MQKYQGREEEGGQTYGGMMHVEDKRHDDYWAEIG